MQLLLHGKVWRMRSPVLYVELLSPPHRVAYAFHASWLPDFALPTPLISWGTHSLTFDKTLLLLHPSSSQAPSGLDAHLQTKTKNFTLLPHPPHGPVPLLFLPWHARQVPQPPWLPHVKARAPGRGSPAPRRTRCSTRHYPRLISSDTQDQYPYQHRSRCLPRGAISSRKYAHLCARTCIQACIPAPTASRQS